jgi:hypothetical protein
MVISRSGARRASPLDGLLRFRLTNENEPSLRGAEFQRPIGRATTLHMGYTSYRIAVQQSPTGCFSH